MLTATTLDTRRQQRGITLIEVSIGLIIAAIIAAAAFIAFQNNQRRSEVRENVATITATLAELQQKFGRTSNYIGLNNTVGLSSGTVEATNSYEGNITICGAAAASVACPGTAPVTGAAAPTNVGILVWEGVPQNQCLDLVSSTMAGARTVLVGANDVAVNGTLTNDATCAVGANTLTWVVATR